MSDFIKLYHAENQQHKTRNGYTVLSDFPLIFAIASTKKQVFKDGKYLGLEYATDIEGLEVVDLKIDESISILSEHIATLGAMFAHCEKMELSEHQLQDFGWLVSGLGELVGLLSNERDGVSECLSKLKIQGGSGDEI